MNKTSIKIICETYKFILMQYLQFKIAIVDSKFELILKRFQISNIKEEIKNTNIISKANLYLKTFIFSTFYNKINKHFIYRRTIIILEV